VKRFGSLIRRSRHSLRVRILLLALLPTFVLGAAGLFSQLTAQVWASAMLRIFDANADILKLDDLRQKSLDSLRAYLQSKQTGPIREYMGYTQQFEEVLRKLDTPVRDDRGSMLRRDLLVLGRTFLDLGNRALLAKRGRLVDEYVQAYRDTEKAGVYLHETVGQISIYDFQNSLRQIREFDDRLSLLRVVDLLMILALMGVAVITAVWSSHVISEPLRQLAEAAGAISRGNWDRRVVPYRGLDEIGALTRSFGRMRESIVNSFQELEESRKAESVLMEERLKNLRMEHLLRHAELQALQSQINPHFLFNTLNAGIQLAVLEDAERTAGYLEHVSDLLRYNIRQLDRPVKLSEELRNLESFVYIMKIRFADRFRFELPEAQPDLDPHIPGMILQPLVENALVHGLRDREDGGVIGVALEEKKSCLEIRVYDNGTGLAQAHIDRLLGPANDTGKEAGLKSEVSDEGENLHHKGSTGIGLANVIGRLRLFTGLANPVSIKSGTHGTTITIQIPLQENDGGQGAARVSRIDR